MKLPKNHKKNTYSSEKWKSYPLYFPFFFNFHLALALKRDHGRKHSLQLSQAQAHRPEERSLMSGAGWGVWFHSQTCQSPFCTSPRYTVRIFSKLQSLSPKKSARCGVIWTCIPLPGSVSKHVFSEM